MPLLDLQTNLKSLKYGQDRPGGGSSGLPYVTFPLPENASTEELAYYDNNRYNIDFPIRGGGFNLDFQGPYVTDAAKYDQLRISRFMKDAPRGKIFILKQTALQLTNPKLQVGSQINLALGTEPFKFLGNLENTRIYNGGKNTLLQVGVQGSGFHFDRHGNVPINPYQLKYIYQVDETIAENANKNRLKALYQTKILSSGRVVLSQANGDLIANLNALGISRNPDLLFQYPGGPTSAGGIGLTTIARRYNSALFKQNPQTQANYFIPSGDGYAPAFTTPHTPGYVDPKSYFGVVSGKKALASSDPASGITTTKIQTALVDLSNDKANIGADRLKYLYNKVIVKKPDSQILYSYVNGPSGKETTVLNRAVNTTLGTDYAKQASLEGRGLGTINSGNFNYAYNYTLLSQQSRSTDIQEDFRKELVDNVTNGTSTDIKNVLASTNGYTGKNNITTRYGIGNPGSVNLKRVDYTKSVNVGNTPVDFTQDMVNMLDVGETGDLERGYVKDLITFRFDTIEIDSQTETPIVFRAFLTNLQDNNSAEYAPFKYVGRGENFYTYNGFTRGLSFNFKVAAQSRSEMKFIYRKVNYLLSQLYPDYQAFVNTQNQVVGNTFMRAPLVRLTIGDYISRQPGFITSMNISIPEEAPWEIANGQQEGADTDIYQLPHMLDISCQYTLIHDFLPRRSYIDKNGVKHITPLITPSRQGNVFGIGL